MLIDNKFIYVNLPRCGSTSFHYSCILSGFDIKNTSNIWNSENSKIDFTKIEESDIMNSIHHGHESLSQLKVKFGNEYPIIAVNRDRHETFYSLFKHVVFDIHRAGFGDLSNWLSNLTLDELFFYKSEDLVSLNKRWDVINEFLIKNRFIKKYMNMPDDRYLYLNTYEYVANILNILLSPKSIWHNNDPNIIWFDIYKINEMEEWVRNITNKPFTLKKVNSSSYIDIKIKLDDEFKLKYNSIYDYYDLPKSQNTII